MNPVYVHTTAVLGTVVTTQIIGHHETSARHDDRVNAVRRAAEWFRVVEATCSRFDQWSELRRLTAYPESPVQVSPLLFELIRFALALAEETDGAFDPTIGAQLEARGFNREHRTGAPAASGVIASRQATFRDVHIDAANHTVTIDAPMVLDLGAVAKGFAIDLAARELAPFENFAIDAGGDLYLGGHNQVGEEWTVGIRHPRRTNDVLESVQATNTAVCTSGDYERVSDEGHHIIDPRSGEPAPLLASVTVVAPLAMVADGLATAAFVLGPERGLELLARHGVRGIMYTPDLERLATA